MNKIKIETLTPVHVGSGQSLYNGMDFIAQNKNLGIIDVDKLGRLIGSDQKTIQEWVTSIDRGTGGEFVLGRTGSHDIKDYSSRVIANRVDFGQYDGTLKECMHDGLGRPYIPGSSIKGAIRTLLLATIIGKLDNDAWGETVLRINERNGRRYTVNDRIENRVLGDIDTDIFRFIRVGDAYFEKGCEAAIRLIMLNIREKQQLRDERKHQAVEVIEAHAEAEFSLDISSRSAYDKSAKFYKESKVPKPMPSFPEPFSSPQELFKMINAKTRQLIGEEIEYWENQGGSYTGHEGYVENLEQIYEMAKTCSERQCVIRVGQSGGWRFTTGAWAEELDEKVFKESVAKAVRGKKVNNNLIDPYSKYDFPKSRRISDQDLCLMGFVRLTIL